MSEFVAAIGENNYATLQAAVDAAPAERTIITMIADTKENVIIPEEKNITLDLNGFTLSGGTDSEPEHKDKAAILNNGTITIKDSSEAGTGMVKREDIDQNSYYVIFNQGLMTIESGTIYNDSGSKGPESRGGSSLICNGDEPDSEKVYEQNYAKLYVKGGNLKQDNFIAIKNGSKGYFEMTGGKVSSKNESAIQNWSNAKVNNGVVNGLIWAMAYDESGDSNTILEGNIAVNGKIWAENYSEDGVKTANVEIDGGNYNLFIDEGKPGPEFRVKTGGDLKIESGSFNVDPTSYMVNADVVRDQNGNYVVRTSNSVRIVIRPRYATRKAYEGVLFNEDMLLTAIDVIAPRQIDCILATAHVAIVCDDKIYPVDVDNFEEQFNLALAGKPLTVDADPKFGIKKIDAFVSASITDDAYKVMRSSEVSVNNIYADLIPVKDYAKLGIDAIDHDGMWIGFKFDLDKATEAGYSDLKFYNTDIEIVNGDNFICISDNSFVGIAAKYTVTDGETSETVNIKEVFNIYANAEDDHMFVVAE